MAIGLDGHNTTQFSAASGSLALTTTIAPHQTGPGQLVTAPGGMSGVMDPNAQANLMQVQSLDERIGKALDKKFEDISTTTSGAAMAVAAGNLADIMSDYMKLKKDSDKKREGLYEKALEILQKE